MYAKSCKKYYLVLCGLLCCSSMVATDKCCSCSLISEGSFSSCDHSKTLLFRNILKVREPTANLRQIFRHLVSVDREPVSKFETCSSFPNHIPLSFSHPESQPFFENVGVSKGLLDRTFLLEQKMT